MTPVTRRAVVAGAAALTVTGPAAAAEPLYGTVGRIRALPGRRAALIAILAEGTGAMPGCVSYVVAEDLADPDAILVTEIWRTREAHAVSLQLPAVRGAIARGRPLIASFETLAETRPVAGVR